MNYISDVLFWISTGLLVPVVVLLIWFFLRSLLLLGGLFGQFLAMRKNSAALREVLKGTDASNVETLAERLPAIKSSISMAYMKKMVEERASKAKVDHLLDQYAQYVDKDMALSNTLLKIGPMLGLMGTLIPMGPALVGLAAGDIASMAYNMQVAFATTVVGLFAAGIGFVTRQTKSRWYAEEMNNLEYVADLLDEAKNRK